MAKGFRVTIGRLIACALVTTAAAPASAHDFWLAPTKHVLDAPGEVRVRFQVGHRDQPEAWDLRPERVVVFRSFGPGESRDLRATVSAPTGIGPGSVRVTLGEPGTHIVAFESTESASELAPAEFNAYAEEEGLALVLAHRRRTGTEEEPGRESFSRRAKTLIQVGDVPTEGALKAIGHTLEIVPERNPYALPNDRQLPVRVMFRGVPLGGALVDLVGLGSAAEPAASQVTDVDGRAVFVIPEGEAWRLNVVWGVPTSKETGAEFATIFASLTFGARVRPSSLRLPGNEL